jgi:hypothetical protein
MHRSARVKGVRGERPTCAFALEEARSPSSDQGLPIRSLHEHSSEGCHRERLHEFRPRRFHRGGVRDYDIARHNHQILRLLIANGVDIELGGKAFTVFGSEHHDA